jgi:hypothetical protein
MDEQEARETLKMLHDLFPPHQQHILVITDDDIQELLETVDRFVPALKDMIKRVGKIEVTPHD